MKLFVLRHGEAEPFMQPDIDRVLTVKGVSDIRSVGEKLKAEAIKLDTIIASPYLRTQQTLNNFQLTYGVVGTAVIGSNAITPDGRLSDVYELLSDFESDKCVMLISHLPLVSLLIASLVTGKESDANQFTMSPASLAEIDLDYCSAGFGVLKRLISPP